MKSTSTHGGPHGACCTVESDGTAWLGYAAVNLDGAEYALSDGTAPACASKEDAIIESCSGLNDWLSGEKERGSKKHRRQAEEVQNWAADLMTQARADKKAANGSPTSQTPEAAVEQSQVEEFAIQTTTRSTTMASGAFVDAYKIPLELHKSEGELKLIPIEQLFESPWNPRQYYPEGPMRELVESMKQSGFREWLPLMVRPHPLNHAGQAPPGYDQYEIGAGHRRRRAAELAGIQMIPCIVRPMTDEQFLDVLNFDNSGREDVHPLHEAAGWRHWMEKTGKSVQDIAARIGQSKEYVYVRLKLAELTEPLSRAFLDGRITLGHAIQIARLAPEVQPTALEEGCFESVWERHGDRHAHAKRLASVRHLAQWIVENASGAHLDEAPFPLDDGELLPAAGACVVCEKQTQDVCLDRVCFERKIDAHVKRETGKGLIAISTSYETKETPAGALTSKEFEAVDEEIEDDGESFQDDEGDDESGQPAGPVEDRLACTSAVKAVVVHGADRGKMVAICRDLECPVHGRQLAWNQRRMEEGSSSGSSKKDFWAEQARSLPDRIRKATRRAQLAAVLRALKPGAELKHELLQLVAEALLPFSVPAELIEALHLPWGESYSSAKNGSAIRMRLEKEIRSPKGSPAADYLGRLLVGLALYEAAKDYVGNDTLDRLKRCGPLCGVDLAKIESDTKRSLTEDFQRKREAAKAKKAAPKKDAAPPPAFRWRHHGPVWFED